MRREGGDEVMLDLVVAGGGPAGLAAAIHAGRAGFRVMVVEPHEGAIDKACGEGIMPHGVTALRSIDALPYGRPFVGIRYVDAGDPGLAAEGSFSAEKNGLGVRRTVLHQALRERARSLRVQFHKGRITQFEDHGDHVAAITTTSSELVRARWLIGADGRRSKIRELLGVAVRKPRFRMRLGLRRHYEMAPWSDRVEVHFANGAEAYITPVAANLVGIAILFFANERSSTKARRTTYDQLLHEHFPHLAARLSKANIRSKTRGAGPFEQRVTRRVKDNVLLIGDAAGYLDPLTGEGIALGLSTAEAAIHNLERNTPSHYEADYRTLTHRHIALTTALLHVAHHPMLHRPFLRLARSTPAAFDFILSLLSETRPSVSPLLRVVD